MRIFIKYVVFRSILQRMTQIFIIIKILEYSNNAYQNELIYSNEFYLMKNIRDSDYVIGEISAMWKKNSIGVETMYSDKTKTESNSKATGKN